MIINNKEAVTNKKCYRAFVRMCNNPMGKQAVILFNCVPFQNLLTEGANSYLKEQFLFVKNHILH